MTVGYLHPVCVVVDALTRSLGSGRQWVDTLNDFRQFRSPGLKGIVLMPAQHTGGTMTTAGQPLYELKDIKDFILAVRAAYGKQQPFKRRAIKYSYDNTPGIHWSARKPAVAVP